MKRSSWAMVPALTAALLGGCGGSPSSDKDDDNASGQTGGNSGTATSTGGASSSRNASAGGNGDGDDTGFDLGEGGSSAACPSTCEELEANCGSVTDSRCGGVVECGSCPTGEVCGVEQANQCAVVQVECIPKTCDASNATCGAVSDGCGSVVECGTCPTGQTCGVTVPNQCGIGTTCTPLTCAELEGVECGPQSDGCGDTIDCGTCDSSADCIDSKCVARPVCEPQTCEDQGVECGAAGDGCGNALDCGNPCELPKICGGDPEEPGKCGCTGVCGQIPDCEAGESTSIQGQVFDPGGRVPLYNALVYIPNSPDDPGLQPFETRTSTCDVCGASAAGDPLVSAQTGVDGTFTLSNVPVGEDITLVVQLGRWRRIYKVDIMNPCEPNVLPDDGVMTMPKNQSEGDIPHIATVTGAADGMECMLWKAGIDTEEFTNPDGDGRVHMYRGSGSSSNGLGAGTKIDDDTPSETELFVDNGAGHIPLIDYDLLVLACQGSDFERDETQQPSLAYWRDLVDYADNGGRIFATHWSHSYLRVGDAENPFSSTATWRDGEPIRISDYTGIIVNDATMNPRAEDFEAWLEYVGALNEPITDPATFDMIDARFDVLTVTPPGQTWVTSPAPETETDEVVPMHYTFNTPVSEGTAASCGRVVYSDFHVSQGNPSLDFPQNCGSWDSFTAQEKVLEFMLFDLSACVTPYVPLCTPTTCEALGYECGMAGDGCGSSIDCGPCPDGEVCGLLTPNQCDPMICTPTTCDALGYECGMAGDGCGDVMDCGECPPGYTCGAAGPNQCGTATCSPITCADQGFECGMAGDGCGNAIDCGACPPPAVCGLFEPGRCGTPSCTPLSCEDQDIECGAAGDGCGAAIDCGPCPAGMVCGLIEPGKCGSVT